MTKVAPPGKNKAIITYITFVGMLIAMSMNSDEKHPFATVHIKNMFGLTLFWIVARVFETYINILLGKLFFITAILLVIYSLIRATQNKTPDLPYLSEWFDKWFTFLD